MYLHCSGAGTGGAGGATGPPIFCRSFNPIRTREVRLSPTITTGPPNVFHLPASLHDIFFTGRLDNQAICIIPKKYTRRLILT